MSMHRGECIAERAKDHLAKLGGLAADDSLRAQNVALAIRGLAGLLSNSANLHDIDGGEVGALALLIAEDVERVAARQLLDEHRRRADRSD